MTGVLPVENQMITCIEMVRFRQTQEARDNENLGNKCWHWWMMIERATREDPSWPENVLIFLTCRLCMVVTDAHFHRPLVIDWFKSWKIDCSNPPQDLGPIKVQFWWSWVLLFAWCHGQACYHFPMMFMPQFTRKDRLVDLCIWTAEACFGRSKGPCIVHGQSV